MLFILSTILTADSPLGRIDKSSFSQQTLVELMTDKITNRERISGDGESPLDIEDWCGDGFFSEIVVDGSGYVTRIFFGDEGLQGSLQLEWMPEVTDMCDFSKNELSGTVDLEHLPDTLQTLNLSHNAFVGTVSLTTLPRKMRALSLNTNQFSGKIDLGSLPSGIESLNLFDNGFYGMTDFSNLPESLTRLYLWKTQLEGEVCVWHNRQLVVSGVAVKYLPE